MGNNEELVMRYNNLGDTKALSELTENNIRLIQFIAQKFTINCNYISFDDLVQEGWSGFYQAIQTYNPDLPNSAKFSTWATYLIRQAIQKHLYQKAAKTQEEESIYKEFGEDLNLLDSIPDPDAETRLWRYVEIRELKTEIEEVMKCLNLKQIEVIKLYYGFTNGTRFTFEEIGKLLGITMQNAKNIHDSAINKLRSTPWGRLRYREHCTERKVYFKYADPQIAAIKGRR